MLGARGRSIWVVAGQRHMEADAEVLEPASCAPSADFDPSAGLDPGRSRTTQMCSNRWGSWP